MKTIKIKIKLTDNEEFKKKDADAICIVCSPDYYSRIKEFDEYDELLKYLDDNYDYVKVSEIRSFKYDEIIDVSSSYNKVISRELGTLAQEV
jgi:hypothetical protein